MPSPAAASIEATFRAEHGRVLGALVASLGDLDLAEDALQETLVTALERWPLEGVPRSPAAWIITTARRKAIDRLRRAQVLARKQAELLAELSRERAGAMNDLDLEDDLPCARLAASPPPRSPAPSLSPSPP
jgi:RNA polymerase sigma-70 factor (ECF subfamily)